MMPRLRVLLQIAVALLLFGTQATAQDDDPLSLANWLTGYDEARSRQVLADHYAGIWQVVHTDPDNQTRRGRAEVAHDGRTISLVLEGPDGPEHYEAIEVDAARFLPDTGPFTGGMTVRFRKVAEPVLSDDGAAIATASPIAVPASQSFLSFEKGEFNLDLYIVWSDTDIPYLQVHIAADTREDRFEGLWYEERSGDLAGGGLSTWIRGESSVEGVLVVDNQLDPTDGMNYPFRPDGTPIDHLSTMRTLVVYGQNLPEFADRADIRSLSPHLSYAPDFRAGEDRRRTIAAALEKAEIPDPDRRDAFIVRANLSAGITPGSKALEVNGATGAWPLVFADQAAALRFVRSANVPTETFFEGDAGFVEISYQTEMPFTDIGIRLMAGEDNPIDVGVLLANRIDDDDPLFTTYRSEPFHLYSHDDESLSPPDDENAFRLAVLQGGVLKAALLDPVQAISIPPVARADIFASPEQLGPLWKDALDRVAACNEDTIEDYGAYQVAEADRVSEVILTELGSRNIPLLNGDHAAALLIRDEFVKLTLELLPEFERQAANITLAREAREAARQRPEIRQQPFWRDSVATFVKERPILWDKETEYSLAETLNIQAIAEHHEVDQEVARNWAEAQTVAAAKAQVDRMELATSFALEAGNCDVGALLMIAGHRSDPVISRLLQRLVKPETSAGPPEREYWVQDHVAQGFVRSLYITGAAVRALETYSDADTSVAVAVAAIATAGASAGLNFIGYAASALWLSLTDAAIGVVTGLMGVEKYFVGEQFYEIAQGAAPALGENILNDAAAGRQSAVMAAVGVILPTISGASNLNQLRHFKTVRDGQRLFQATDGILDDLSNLDDAARTDLAAYYLDMLRQANRSGVDSLKAADHAAFAKFQDHFAAEGLVPPNPANLRAGSAAGSPPPSPGREPDIHRMASEAEAAAPTGQTARPDPNATVEIRPTTDPNEMATQIGPNPRQGRPDLIPEPTPPGPRPGDAENIFEHPPGQRLTDRGVTDNDIRDLIRRSEEGASLSPEEILDKLDSMRLQRQQAREAAAAAVVSD